MIAGLRRHIARHLKNISGWQTDRKIVVIESDDWGSIRMPSKQVFNNFLRSGYRVDQAPPYERYDSLASTDDLELLFNVLSSIEDQNGKPAVITANILTANPDFDKIKASGYQEYFYELITKTFDRYPRHANCLNLWKGGYEAGIFHPQSHGREHLNVSLFMNALQEADEDVLFAFKNRLAGSIPKSNPMQGNQFVESLRFANQDDKQQKLSIILEGLDLFESLMGYRSETFIPPNYLWSPDYDESMSKKGVRFYQGNWKMQQPLFDGSVQMNRHRLGEENKFGQQYLVRNATFEPAMVTTGKDPVGSCLQDISAAFRLNKPAIICSHRLNFVGFIDETNRDRNLQMLQELLSTITKRWPQVEFLNSVELGNMMVSENGRHI